MGVWKLFLDQKRKNGIAINNFNGENQLFLKIKIGDIIQIFEESEEWYRGCKKYNPEEKGIFPKSFIKLFEKEKLDFKDKSVNEIEGVLKEWASIWLEKFDEIEHQKKNHCLMGYFKNGLNLKNVIVENRASIDEIRDLKKSNISKILQGNCILGLDVIAFDSNYNRLQHSDSTTLFLFEELKKNSEINNQTLPTFNSVSSKEEQINDSFFQKFEHKFHTSSNTNLSKSSSNYCLKVSLESLLNCCNYQLSNENTELCVNMYLYKEGSPENSFYLCENAYFKMADLIDKNLINIQNSANSFQRTSLNENNEKFVFFCDICEKDFEYTKRGFKLLLVVYSIKHTKLNGKDQISAITRKFAGGVYDLGSNLCNLVYVSADIRNFQASMILHVSEFDSSIVSNKYISEFLNIKEMSDLKNSRSLNKDSYFTLTFRIELYELSYKNVISKYSHLNPKICRKMNFPEIIMPDDFRNEFYITIIGGEFQKARNYEIIVNVIQIKEENNIKTEEPVSFDEESCQNDTNSYFFYKSIVYPKQDKPKWNEIVKINIPCGKKVKELKKLYLRFLIRSRSQDTKDKNKILGVSYLQITNEDGSAIADMHCYLPINKIENELDPKVTEGRYIPLKFQSSNCLNWYFNPDKMKEFIEIRVKVVSTQLTQNVTLLNLLSFPIYETLDEQHYQCLLGYLNELSSLKDEQTAEIIKFLQAILDKLIDILLDLKNKNDKISEKTIEFHKVFIQPRVFEILVLIFQIIENQSKYASFKSVIDAYLEKNFCITLVHKPILRIFNQMLTDSYEKYKNSLTNKENEKKDSKKSLQIDYERTIKHSSFTSSLSLNSNNNDLKDELLINAIKSIEYIFKFSFRSRELLSIYNKSNNINTKGETFDKDIENIFKQMVELTQLDTKNITSNENMVDTNIQSKITNIQIFILKNVINLIPILINSQRYQFENISKLFVGFFESSYAVQTQFLSRIIRTQLFELSESRKILLLPMCNVIKDCLRFTKDIDDEKTGKTIETIGKITAELMNVLEKHKIGNIDEEIIQISTLLPRLSAIFLSLDNKNSAKQLYGTIIISIMRIMNHQCFDAIFDVSLVKEQLEDYVNNCPSLIDKNVFIRLIKQKGLTNKSNINQLLMIQLIDVCRTLMEEVFPKNWYELLILRNLVVYQALNNISEKIIIYHYENFDSVNKIIWTDYFECMVLIAIHPSLQIENLKRIDSKKFDKNDDLRVKVANQIKKMWHNLADKKSKLIPDIVPLFMKISLLPVKKIQFEIIPIIFDMINCEYINKGSETDFNDFLVPKLIITTIDQLLEFRINDISFRNSYEKIMKDKFNSHIHLKKNQNFVKNLVDLCDLLVEYSTLEEDSSDQLKTYYLNEILNFYGNLKRYDIYVKYIEKLRKIHKKSRNLVCAANTLKLHAELLYWTNQSLEPYLIHDSFKNEKIHKNLKESLFLELIKDYTLGLAWEKAFEFSKILRGIYESEFDFEKLNSFLRQQADLCENIIKTNRYECKYFLVGFYGKKFPRLFENKQFVFRSEPLEQIMTFRQRVESWFPNSIRISHSYPVTQSEFESQNQYIQVISVNPIYEPVNGLNKLKVSNRLIKYYEHNEVKKFKFSYRKDSVLNEDDPTQWWLVEKYVTISNSLPDVINFYDVIEENTVEISPIQNAINIVNERLTMLKESYRKIEKKNEVSESDKLLIQGTIDPGVLGGLPKYKRFFNNLNNFEDSNLIEYLKQLIIETINWGEALLETALYHLPTDHLLNIIKMEQLPKLKKLFEIPISKNIESKIENDLRNIESTPKILTKTQNSNEQTGLNKSFLNKVNYTERILSYLGVGEKPNTNSFISNSSHRDSISSIKSLNSDEEFSSRKIILDEAISSKRPLRRFQNLNYSSTSNSNPNSRPMSNLSSEEQNIIQNVDPTFDIGAGETEDKAPPKPPKMKNIQIKSRENIKNISLVEKYGNDQSKSSTSLNSVHIKNLSSKTISDSVLNKGEDYEDC